MNETWWQAIVTCDASYDGVFFYGLSTTGIYCKPSCKSRTPKRENVATFTDPSQAEAEGLRPCKRCDPQSRDGKSAEQLRAAEVRLLLDGAFPVMPTLAELSSRLYVSPFYLQKNFKRFVGRSPFAYMQEKRIEVAKRLLSETDDTMTSIATATGFRNSAHFASFFRRFVGQSPTQYRLLRSGKLEQKERKTHDDSQ